MYPISQVQEPYSVVGYLAARVPLVNFLQLVHPLNRADSDREGGVGDENHPWSAWDVCDGEKDVYTELTGHFTRFCWVMEQKMLTSLRKNLVLFSEDL